MILTRSSPGWYFLMENFWQITRGNSLKTQLSKGPHVILILEYEKCWTQMARHLLTKVYENVFNLHSFLSCNEFLHSLSFLPIASPLFSYIHINVKS